MSTPGVDEETARSRSVLLDAIEALSAHAASVIVVGAHAVYLRSGEAAVAVAEYTRDSDIALDPRALADEPLIEAAMRDAGFRPADTGRPGAWTGAHGVPVDLMVPATLTRRPARRSAKIPPHGPRVARTSVGLEAAVVDSSLLTVDSLSVDSPRRCVARVAGPMALIVGKAHKLHERKESPRRLEQKDAHDIYRMLVAVATEELAHSAQSLLSNAVSRDTVATALDYLDDLFARGPGALGSMLAGRTEELVGSPETVAASTSVLARDLLDAIAAPESSRRS